MHDHSQKNVVVTQKQRKFSFANCCVKINSCKLAVNSINFRTNVFEVGSVSGKKATRRLKHHFFVSTCDHTNFFFLVQKNKIYYDLKILDGNQNMLKSILLSLFGKYTTDVTACCHSTTCHRGG